MASPVHYPSLSWLAVPGHVCVTGDYGADRSAVEVKRQVGKEIGERGPDVWVTLDADTVSCLELGDLSPAFSQLGFQKKRA